MSPPASLPPLLSHCERAPEFSAGHVAAQKKDGVSQRPLQLGIATCPQRGRRTCRLHIALTPPPFQATGTRHWGRARLDHVDGDTLPGRRKETQEAQHPGDFAEQSLGLSQERTMYFHLVQAAVMFGLPVRVRAAKTYSLTNWDVECWDRKHSCVGHWLPSQAGGRILADWKVGVPFCALEDLVDLSSVSDTVIRRPHAL